MTSDGVEKLLNDLKTGKAPGPDGLNKEDLCIDTRLIANCLTLIFNASLRSAKLPAGWKLANIIPVHKKGQLDMPNNYRPISLTSIPCKLLEHIVLHYLNKLLDPILHNRQHGFRRGLSCETQLCGTLHEIARSMNNSHTTHALVLDFQKAFDKVPHKLLIHKLSNVDGINPHILRWLQNFLTKREQQVIIDGHSSGRLPVFSGVPQGSVLGPTLFLLYINDLPDLLSCSVSLFADDTLIFQEVDSLDDVRKFQKNIEQIENWSLKWKMPFNSSKCRIMSFGKDPQIQPSYRLGGETLPYVDEITYLGVTLQFNLKFHSHITKKINKAYKVLGMLKRSLYGAPKKAKLLAYMTLCRPILEYAATTWDPVTKQLVKEIELVQNRAIRFICCLKGREASISDAREQLNISSLEDRRKSLRITLLLKILSKEECHQALSSSYTELTRDKSTATVTTRAASNGIPTAISAMCTAYHNSFLPRTIRDLRIGTP